MTQQIGDSELLHTWGATGDVVEPAEAKKDTGWESGERPAHEYMNWVHNALGQAVNHILKNGTPVWNSATEYTAGASVQHSGSVWVAQATSTNSQPSDANSNWARLLDLDELDARFEPQLQHNDSATTDPGVTDDSDAGYSVRSNWINTNSGEVFRCIDATPGAAVWVKTTLTLDELGSAATVDTGTSAGQIPVIGTASATTTAAGLVELLTQAEAEGGTDNTRAATILRVAQYLATQLVSNGGNILDAAQLVQNGGNVFDLEQALNATDGDLLQWNQDATRWEPAGNYWNDVNFPVDPDPDNAQDGEVLAWNDPNGQYERAPINKDSVQVWSGSASTVDFSALSETSQGWYSVRFSGSWWVAVYYDPNSTPSTDDFYSTVKVGNLTDRLTFQTVRIQDQSFVATEYFVDTSTNSVGNSALTINEIRKIR